MDTPPRDKSTSRKYRWGTGAMADVFMNNSFGYLAFPIYNIGLGVDPRLLGWALGVPRLWEAVTDILIGTWSDNSKSRWGRRQPFVAIGAVLCGLFFALIWSPPTGAGPVLAGWYFFLMAMLYYAALSLFSVPWGAAGLELGRNYHERTQVQAIRTFLQSFAGLFLGTLWWLSFQWGGGDALKGVHWVGLFFGLMIMVAGLVGAVEPPTSSAIQSQPKIKVTDALWGGPMRNREFLRICAIVLLVIISLFLVQPMTLYINIYHVFGGNKEPVAALNMVMNFVFQGVGLAWVPLVSMTSRRYGKKRTLQAGLLIMIVGKLITWYTYTPAFPYLQSVSLALSSVGLACLWILSTSMIADVCRVDERENGVKREGVFNAAFGWITKLGSTVSIILSGYLISWSGFNAALDDQPEAVVTRLRLLFMLVPVFFLAGALWVSHSYRLDEASVDSAEHPSGNGDQDETPPK
jgi:GPH family glycoside/pentoside/hexuronide:cation symporter